MHISDLSRLTSVSVHALRHYERLGLIVPRRKANGYRDYTNSTRRDVIFIATARRLGLGLQDIADHLAQWKAGYLSFADLAHVLDRRHAEVEADIDRLRTLQAQLRDASAWLRDPQRAPVGTTSNRTPATPWAVRPRSVEPSPRSDNHSPLSVSK